MEPYHFVSTSGMFPPGRALTKASSGVHGLDHILDGGFPRGRTTLVNGGPGSGKTILGLEFIYNGILAGEPGIFVSFEERADDIRRNAASLGWDFSALEKEQRLFLFEARLTGGHVISGDFDLQGLLAIIGGRARAIGARRIVIDAIDVLLRIFNDPVRERNEIYALNDWLKARDLTTLITSKNPGGSGERFGYMDFMADCVIAMDQRIVGQISTRRMQVVKYRGSAFFSNEHPFVINERGLVLVPVTAGGLPTVISSVPVPSGHPVLDRALGGGYRTGSCVLITGQSGTGKTSLAATFARSALERGEKVLYVNFEESREMLMKGLQSIGIDLTPHVDAGRLMFMSDLPESTGTEEHLIRAFDRLGEFQPKYLIVDAISACGRMGSDKAAFDYLMRLTHTAKSRGITILLTNQSDGDFENGFSGMNFSSLVDTLILIRYKEAGDGVERSLLVLKSRGMGHSMKYHRLTITENGVDLQEPATDANH